LLARGASVTVFDPKGMDNFNREFNLPVRYAHSAEEAIRDQDAVVFQTEWKQFRKIHATHYARLMREPVIIDGRRTVDAAKLKKAGARYLAIGAPNEP